LPIDPSILDNESNKVPENDFEWAIKTGKKVPIYIEKYLYKSPFLLLSKKID
jgi:hypothetical protein